MTAPDPYDKVTRALAEVTGHQPPREGGDWLCPAPDHHDTKPSLSVSRGRNGTVVIKCHRGCHLNAILDALKLKPADLFPPRDTNSRKSEITSTYRYTDPRGTFIQEVVRFTPKGFAQRRPATPDEQTAGRTAKDHKVADGTTKHRWTAPRDNETSRAPNGWIWSYADKSLLYRLPEVLQAVTDGQRIFITEGEKDADAIHTAGEVATTNPMGAGSWNAAHARWLEGAADVVVLADHDQPGYQHARSVMRTLTPIVTAVTVAAAKSGKDAADHLAAGLTTADFEVINPVELDDLCNPPAANDTRNGDDHEPSPPPPPADDDILRAADREALRLTIQASASRGVDGATFILDAPTTPPAVWGQDDQILWAEGEEIMLAGPDGVGKTTLVQQIVFARCGIGNPEVLGYPLIQSKSKVLYIAADRPPQAQRSMRRMVSEEDRDLLRERLVVWRGPLPQDLGKTPDFLAVFAGYYGADTIVIDSLKDVAVDLSKDETGSRVNQGIQTALAENIEIVTLHHQRKPQSGAPAPRSLGDVYGSRWLTGGCGSVFMLWGEAGDSVIELSHLKQPMEDVGPLRMLHDHVAGHSTIIDRVDVWELVNNATRGTTAHAVATALFDTNEPSRKEIEKARRRLDGLARTNRIHKQGGSKGGGKDRDSALYFPITHAQQEAG